MASEFTLIPEDDLARKLRSVGSMLQTIAERLEGLDEEVKRAVDGDTIKDEHIAKLTRDLEESQRLIEYYRRFVFRIEPNAWGSDEGETWQQRAANLESENADLRRQLLNGDEV